MCKNNNFNDCCDLIDKYLNEVEEKCAFGEKFFSEFVYRLNEKSNLLNTYNPFCVWSVPCVGFLYDNSLSEKSFRKLQKKSYLDNEDKIICGLYDFKDSYKGVFFTNNVIFVNTGTNKVKRFKINYFNIKNVVYNNSKKNPSLEIYTHSDKCYILNTCQYNLENIKIILEFAMGFYLFNEEELVKIKEIELDTLNGKSIAAAMAGIAYGVPSTGNTMWGMGKFGTKNGHGFAAERINHLYDFIKGKQVEFIGDNNALNGADRIVDGASYQCKYCCSGSACVNACFDVNGFRYMLDGNTAMKIEVPSDMYDDAIKAMERKIIEGKVPNYSKPEEAKDIIVKGRFTYNQAVRVAKSGTVESILYDSVTGLVTCLYPAGITFVLSYASAVWNGASQKDALKTAGYDSFCVGGIHVAANIVSCQLARSGKVMKPIEKVSKSMVKKLGTEKATLIANALRKNGKNIYGAAATKHIEKILKNNLVTVILNMVASSGKDGYEWLRGRISGKQAFKNIIISISAMAGGMIGIGGGIGGTIFGSYVFKEVMQYLMDKIIDDDSKKIIKIIEDKFPKLIEDNLLTIYEIENVCDNFKADFDNKKIKELFKNGKKLGLENAVDEMIQKYIDYEMPYREKIVIQEDQLSQLAWEILEDICKETVNAKNEVVISAN